MPNSTVEMIFTLKYCLFLFSPLRIEVKINKRPQKDEQIDTNIINDSYDLLPKKATLILFEYNRVNRTSKKENKKWILYTVDKTILLYFSSFLFSANNVTTPVVAEPVLTLVIIALRFSNWLNIAKDPGPDKTANNLTIAMLTPDFKKTEVKPVNIPSIRLLLFFIRLIITNTLLLPFVSNHNQTLLTNIVSFHEILVAESFVTVLVKKEWNWLFCYKGVGDFITQKYFYSKTQQYFHVLWIDNIYEDIPICTSG